VGQIDVAVEVGKKRWWLCASNVKVVSWLWTILLRPQKVSRLNSSLGKERLWYVLLVWYKSKAKLQKPLAMGDIPIIKTVVRQSDDQVKERAGNDLEMNALLS
jgi:hypothetical protein